MKQIGLVPASCNHQPDGIGFKTCFCHRISDHPEDLLRWARAGSVIKYNDGTLRRFDQGHASNRMCAAFFISFGPKATGNVARLPATPAILKGVAAKIHPLTGPGNEDQQCSP
jgi:hypothetical protein